MKTSVVLLLTHSFLLLFCSTIKANSIEKKVLPVEHSIVCTIDSIGSEKVNPDSSVKARIDSTHLETAKGAIRFSLALPYVNLFNFQFPNETFKAVGFLGAGAGIDFFYKDNHYISLNAGISTSAGLPAKKVSGYDTTATIFYTDIKNNLVLGDFSFGYGINASQIEWHNKIVTDSINLNQTLKNIALGLDISAQYHLGKSFYFQVSYQPDFLTINPSLSYKYQQFISFGFVYKLTLKAGKHPLPDTQTKRRKVYIFY